MVLISEVGDSKYITKVRWFFGNPSNYLPLILHLGPNFDFFFPLFFSLQPWALSLYHSPSNSGIFSGKEMVSKKTLKVPASAKAEHHTQPHHVSSDGMFHDTFLIQETDFFFSSLKTHDWAIQVAQVTFRIRFLTWDWGNIPDGCLSHPSVKMVGEREECLPAVVYLQR